MADARIEPTTTCPTCGQTVTAIEWTQPADVFQQPDLRGAEAKLSCGHEFRGALAIRLIDALRRHG